MSLIGLARWTEQPAYLGWLAPAMTQTLEELEERLRRCIADGDPLPPDTESKIQELRGAFHFLGSPQAVEASQHLIKQSHDLAPATDTSAVEALRSMYVLQQTLAYMKHGAAAVDPAGAPNAQAIGELRKTFSETLRTTQDTWDIAAPAHDWDSISQTLPQIQELAWALAAIGAPGPSHQLAEIQAHLEQLCRQPSEDDQKNQQAIEQQTERLVQLHAQLEDLLTGQPLTDHLSASEARRALEVLAALVTEELDHVRHHFLEAIKQNTDLKDSVPAMERIAATFQILEKDVAAEQAWLLARRFALENAHLDMADALVSFEMAIQGLAMSVPLLAQDSNTTNEVPGTAKQAFAWQEVRQALEEAGATMNAWVAQSRNEDAQGLRKTILKARLLPPMPETGLLEQVVSQVEALLAQLLSSIGQPSLHDKAAVLQAFRALLAFVSQGPENRPPSQALEEASERLAQTLARRAQPKQKSALPQLDVQNLARDWPALAPDAEEAFWDFVSTHWPVLVQADHPDFWTALYFLETALSMIGAAPYAAILSKARQERVLDFMSSKVLAMLYAHYQKSRPPTTAEHLLIRLQHNLDAARKSLEAQDEAAFRLQLSHHLEILHEHGYQVPSP